MMTDLELMELLDEAGYEPCIENVQILKEDEDALYELVEGLHPFKAAKQFKKDSADVNNARENLVSTKGTLKRLKGEFEEVNGKKATERNMKKVDPSVHSEVKYAKDSANVAKKYLKTAKNNRAGNTARALVSGNMTEDVISDYELYQILDESGYKPNERNLYLLKEGLESGKYEIVEEDSLDEGFISDWRERRLAGKAASAQTRADQLSSKKDTLENARLNQQSVKNEKSDAKAIKRLDRLKVKENRADRRVLRSELPNAKLQHKIDKYSSK
jgi:hypothetical protein